MFDSRKMFLLLISLLFVIFSNEGNVIKRKQNILYILKLYIYL